MEPDTPQQVAGLAGDHPCTSGREVRRCVRSGCLEVADWIISDPQRGELPACEIDLDLLLNDALARVPPDTSMRVEIWRMRITQDCGSRRRNGPRLWTSERVAVEPNSYRCRMTKRRNTGTAP
jgi:hypothetical protein